MYHDSSIKHGGSCVGLAVGVRAAFLASNILGNLVSEDRVMVGTRNCMAEAFRMVYPKAHTVLRRERNNQITVQSRNLNLQIKFAPKKKYRDGTQALSAPDWELFESVNLNQREK